MSASSSILRAVSQWGAVGVLFLAALFPARTALAVDAWPADGGTDISGGLPSGYEPSDVVWHKGLEKLFLVSDDGWISRMDLDGGNKYTWYVESADYEGITIADHDSNYVYVATEQTQILVKEFNVSFGALTGKTWRLTEMEGSGNSGLEALTFVPNGFHPYAESSSGGVFYAGKEGDGKVYVYDINLSSSGSRTYLGTISPPVSLGAIGGLHFEPDTAVLYVMFRDAQVVAEAGADGSYIAAYYRPDCCQEGITVVTSCPSSLADVVISHDDGPVTLYRDYPVSCLGGDDDFVKGPWVQNVRTTSAVVMWEADQVESPTPTVSYGLTDSCELGSVTATHSSVNGYHVYAATLSGLSSGTSYHYRASSGSTQSADATLRTAPASGETGFRFYVVGDNRTYPYTWEAVSAMILADMEEYPAHHQTFVLHSGDIATDGDDYAAWDELWPPAEALCARMPLYVGLGNHEDTNGSDADAFIGGYFAFPYAESGSTDEKWYSFDYGNVHVTAVAEWDDAGFAAGAQHSWLEADLDAASSAPDTDWRFGIMHFVPWSIGDHGAAEAAEMQTYLHPLFGGGRMDCAFGAHNHLYCRYAPIDDVTYITTGGAGAPFHTGTYTAWAGGTIEASVQGMHHFCVVDVEEDAVSVRAIGTDGSRLDYVTFGGTTENRPPFADAGADVEATLGDAPALDGGASENPEGGGVSYTWSQVGGPAVTLSDASAAAPSFTTAIPEEYLFRLRVHDGTHQSAPDFCAAVVDSGTLTFTPEADTYTDNLNPSTNYGTATLLRVDTSPNEFHACLRFNVAGVTGDVARATLRVYCTNAGDVAEIRACPDTDWAETAPTWDSPLTESGETVGSLITTTTNAWAEADVTGAVAGNGARTLVVMPGDSEGVAFHSRENTNAPQLVVRYRADFRVLDSDSDGLSDYDEIMRDGDAAYAPWPAGGDSSTTSPDTDGDGAGDYLEVAFDSDPVDPEASPSIMRFNFQPSSSYVPSYFFPAGGEAYSARGYGWR